MRNPAEDYKAEALLGRSNVNMVIPSSIGDAFKSIYQEITGDVVFPMVSDIFKGFNTNLLKAKSCGFSGEEAQAIAISDYVNIPGLADDFEPDDSVTVPPPTTENCGVSYLLIPDDFEGVVGDFPAIPDDDEQCQFNTADAEETYAEMEAEAAQK